MKVDVVFIDFQNTFCDASLQELPVDGAWEDALRAADMVRRLSPKIDDIHCTLDSHHPVQIFHPVWWRNTRTGEHPKPYDVITVADLNDNVWTTTKPSLYTKSKKYVEALAANNKYVLCIWPYHGLIGTPGHNLVPALANAIKQWELDNFAVCDMVPKGSGLFSEHYSVVKAEIPDPNDPTTQLNTRFIETLESADMVIIGGEALSHCVKSSVEDVADGFKDDKYISKLWLCTDLTSPVKGFEQQGQDFIDRMVKRGMNLTTSTQILA